MKSAYELAMEKLQQEQGALKPLTDDQKERLEALSKEYKARIVERELALKPQIEAAVVRGDLPEATKLDENLQQDIAKLSEQLEEKKEAIRAEDQGT